MTIDTALFWAIVGSTAVALTWLAKGYWQDDPECIDLAGWWGFIGVILYVLK